MAVNVFISYSHNDEPYKDELITHLKILERNGLILSWNDRMINPSQDWGHEIDSALKRAQLILLLISPDFIASDYCYKTEMTEAIKMHTSEKAKVVPIIIRPCNFLNTPFAKFQALPKNARAVSLWANTDEAYLDISRGIEKLFKPSLKEDKNGVSEVIVQLVNKPKVLDIVVFIFSILSLAYLTFWLAGGLDMHLSLDTVYWNIAVGFCMASLLLILYLVIKCSITKFKKSLNLYSLIMNGVAFIFYILSEL